MNLGLKVVLTLVEVKFVHKLMQVFLPFGHPMQVDTSSPQVNCTHMKFATLQLAHPFGHPSQVCMQVLVSQTYIDLH